MRKVSIRWQKGLRGFSQIKTVGRGFGARQAEAEGVVILTQGECHADIPPREGSAIATLSSSLGGGNDAGMLCAVVSGWRRKVVSASTSESLIAPFTPMRIFQSGCPIPGLKDVSVFSRVSADSCGSGCDTRDAVDHASDFGSGYCLF
jgi:hypothetical protein